MVRALHYGAGDHTNPVKTVDFTYNKLGRLISYDDGRTSAAYTYDDLQRKLTETVNYGPFSKSYSYAYYGNGTKKSFTGPDGTAIEYGYDENNRLSAITIPGQGQVTYNTYQWNSPTRITLPGGTRTDYTYDPLMQLKSIGVKDPAGNSVLTRDYQYSPVGNITTKNTEHGNYTYQYDALYRLTGATNPGSTNEAYTYDPLGNRLTSLATTGEWAYNRNNELLGYDSVSYAYDDNGNMTGKTVAGEARSYAYNTEDRLVRVEDGQGGVVAEYGYDPFGRRLWKQVGGARTYFLYSDEGLVGEYDATGQETRTYGYEPNSTWSTNPVFLKVGGAYYFYENDHLGTPQKLVSTTGAVVWAATYDSFGNCRITTEVITSNLRLAGQYYDAETGLYYNWHRYYDPALGRYLQTDPYGEGLNLYAYCSNNPTGFIDPLGFCAAKKAWGWYKDFTRWVIGIYSRPLLFWADLLGESGYWPLQIAGALIKTQVIVVAGILSSPIDLVDQISDFINSPSLATLPILGPLGQAIGESYGEAVDNPNYETISKAVGMTCFGVATALSGAAAARSAGLTGAAEGPPGRVVIGENMERVRAAAQRLGAETFEGGSMETNRAWIQMRRAQGYEVHDIGPDFSRRARRVEQGLRPDSPFYDMERMETKGYGGYRKQFTRTGKYQGGVPGLDW